MADYEVNVITGNLPFATTHNSVYIKLIGTDGQSERKDLSSWIPSFFKGTVSLKYP